MHVVEGPTNSIILHVCIGGSHVMGVRKSVTCMLLKFRQTVSCYICVGGRYVMWVLRSR